MSKITCKFTDAQLISVPSKKDIKTWQDSFGNTYDAGKKVLRVTMEATHAAMVNLNNRWYSPSKMMDGALTFINNNKPAKVLKHHDSTSDPVGVVRGARFIPTVPEDLADNPDVMTLMSESADMKDQIKAMKRLMKSGITSRQDWEGLGYIELVADILDSESIEQIHDGRFDAVSTSFRSPGHAYCFVCGQNWAQDGLCEHSDIGEVYQDEEENEWPMMLIPGLHLYDEVSLVVKDADPLTAITISDGEEDGYNKKINYDDTWLKGTKVSNCKFEFKDSIEEDNDMAKKQKKLSDKAKSVLELIKTFRPEVEEKDLADFAIKIAELQLEDGKYPNQEEADIDENTAVKYALEDLETADQKIKEEEVYAEIEKELKELELEDAKLSSETRKKLPGSAFCGPDRSFPVPDCAHVTAARRLIGRYKGPGNKSDILACVNRKAKALGCNSSKEDSVETSVVSEDVKFRMPSCECIAAADNEEILALFAKVEVECIDRKLKLARECSKCADSAKEILTAKEELQSAQKDLEDAKTTLAVLREELKLNNADYVHQVDAFIAQKAELRKNQEEKLAIVGTLVGKYKSMNDAIEDLKQSDINTLEVSIMDSFEIDKVCEKLNDGMTNKPEGDSFLESPAVITDGDNLQMPEGLSKVAQATVESIKELISDNKKFEAQQLFNKMKSRGIFPDFLTFETISAENKAEQS